MLHGLSGAYSTVFRWRVLFLLDAALPGPAFVERDTEPTPRTLNFAVPKEAIA